MTEEGIKVTTVGNKETYHRNQDGNISGYLWERYLITVNQNRDVDSKTVVGVISTSQLGTFGSRHSFRATLYQRNNHRKWKLCIDVVIYIVHMQAPLECYTWKWKDHTREAEIIPFLAKFCFQLTLIVNFYKKVKILGRLNCIFYILYFKFDDMVAFYKATTLWNI